LIRAMRTLDTGKLNKVKVK